MSYYTSDTIMRISRTAQASGDRRRRIRRDRVRAHLLVAGQPRHVGHSRQHAAARARRHDHDAFHRLAAKKWEIHAHRQVVDARQDGDEVEADLRRRLDDPRRRAAGRDRPCTQRRPAGRRTGRGRRGQPRPGARRRIPTHHCARHLRAGRRQLGLPAQARRQPRGAGGAAQPAVRLGRHRLAGRLRSPVRAVGGVHRPADRQRRSHRKPGPRTGLQHQGEGAGLQRRGVRLGDGGHHRDREDHRRRRHRV